MTIDITASAMPTRALTLRAPAATGRCSLGGSRNPHHIFDGDRMQTPPPLS